MTNEEILIEVAKIDGWTWDDYIVKKPNNKSPGTFRFKEVKHTERTCNEDAYGNNITESSYSKVDCLFNILPAYTTSHDAILPVIGKQPLDVQLRFIRELNLSDLGEPAGDEWEIQRLRMLLSTPLQLCTALLKAKGVWK